MKKELTVGVVSIQGDFEKHLVALTRIENVRGIEVRTPEELAKVNSLIIPGGESTTVGKLMNRFGLGDAIIGRVKTGMPLWGTCMGMILLAQKIEECDQYSLNLLDITVRRNAFGTQVHSFESVISFADFEAPFTAVFIRAPIVVEHEPSVCVLARYHDKIVAVRQGNILGTSFHPELTDDTRIHEWFVNFTKLPA